MRKILLSILTIGLVASVAFGATRAYFSDTAMSTGNTFSAGTMEFRIARPGSSGEAIFNISDLKPGQIVEGFLVVVNDSTAGLDMKWKAWIPNFSNGTLDDVLEVQVTMNPADYNPSLSSKYIIAGPADTILRSWTPISNLGSGNTILRWEKGGVTADAFEVNWAAVYKIEVMMQDTANDDYQGKSFTGNLEFYATQDENTVL